MKPITYQFGELGNGTLTLMSLTNENISLNKGGRDISYPLEDIREVNLGYRPALAMAGIPNKAYFFKLFFKNGLELEVPDSNDLNYSKFLIALHKYLIPHIKTTKFTKSIAFERMHFSFVNMMKLLIGLMVLIIFSPIILLAVVISIPFWGPAAIGFFVNLISAFSHKLRHKYSQYKPQNLPDLQIPIKGRKLAHDFSASME